MLLAAREPDGLTLRGHLQRLYNNTGRVDDLLIYEIPAAGTAVWNAYMALAYAAQGGTERAPIAWADIHAWSQLNGVRLTTWELETLLALDAATMAKSKEKYRSEH